MKRNVLFLVGALILVVALIFVYRLARGGPIFVEQNPPQAAPTPCILTGIPANPPNTLCRDRCLGGDFHSFPELLDSTTGKYGCCPDGFELRNNNGTPFCKKR
jgi:hypothetical protein